ncbi:hypothetical protein ACA910_017391 [Epithemia clementina (nom. ined.)]
MAEARLPGEGAAFILQPHQLRNTIINDVRQIATKSAPSRRRRRLSDLLVDENSFRKANSSPLQADASDNNNIGVGSSRTSNNNNRSDPKIIKNKKSGVTLKEFAQRVLENPAKYLPEGGDSKNKKKKKATYKRTRKRVENPQQTYLYAPQRRQRLLEQQQQQKQQEGQSPEQGRGLERPAPKAVPVKNINDDDDADSNAQQQTASSSTSVADLLRELHMTASAASILCDPDHDDGGPKFMGQVRIGSADDGQSSQAYAYIIDKPAGWAILGSKEKVETAVATTTETTTPKRSQELEQQTLPPQPPKKGDQLLSSSRGARSRDDALWKRVKVVDEDIDDKIKKVEYLEYNELDVFALMTTAEIEEFLDDGGELPDGLKFDGRKIISVGGGSNSDKRRRPTVLLQQEQRPTQTNNYYLTQDLNQNTSDIGERWTPAQLENIRRIQARAAIDAKSMAGESVDNILPTSTRRDSLYRRPSVVQWLKEFMAQPEEQGGFNRTIRGGNFWKAVAGATQVDDSGLVLLCPKSVSTSPGALDRTIFCDSIEYLAVVGTGGHLAPKSNITKSEQDRSNSPRSPRNNEGGIRIEQVTKVKKARTGGGSSSTWGADRNTNKVLYNQDDEDVVETLRLTIPERPSTCDDIVPICQEHLKNGICGDPAAHPLDRRARRRLIHCQAMTVSSLVHDDDPIFVQVAQVPDDVRIWSERPPPPQQYLQQQRMTHLFTKGSFLGRHTLQQSSHTTAYREINGAADGFPGWTVDRYDKWLFVQHDPNYPRGPLPSIHDGCTAGVYYLETRRPNDLSFQMSSSAGDFRRPRLLEGQAAPDFVTVLENDVKYLVSLDKDLSTGLFLDQRPQRQWLARHCGPTTRVLNCFAHTGAFSVAAATAGASTVSIDLSQKWLQRLPQHFKANNMNFDERHDAIYGDCFDWLSRLAKRGETFDIVILDPPTASFVGGRKKKRWSVQQDTEELVALAAQLVQPGGGGLLWTTTNHAGISAAQWARLCRNGLDEYFAVSTSGSGVDGSLRNRKRPRLDRIQPMPTDFPSIGPQSVKNLVWRLP